MKKFKFSYSVLVKVLLAIVLLLSLAGLVWNVFNVVEFIKISTFKGIVYILLVLLIAILVIITLGIIFYGTYVIDGDTLYSYFGVIKTKANIKDMVEIAHFKKSNKLVVYFKDAKYTVIIISPTLYDEFIKAIREVNPQVIYETKIDGEDTPNS